MEFVEKRPTSCPCGDIISIYWIDSFERIVNFPFTGLGYKRVGALVRDSVLAVLQSSLKLAEASILFRLASLHEASSTSIQTRLGLFTAVKLLLTIAVLLPLAIFNDTKLLLVIKNKVNALLFDASIVARSLLLQLRACKFE